MECSRSGEKGSQRYHISSAFAQKDLFCSMSQNLQNQQTVNHWNKTEIDVRQGQNMYMKTDFDK